MMLAVVKKEEEGRRDGGRMVVRGVEVVLLLVAVALETGSRPDTAGTNSTRANPRTRCRARHARRAK